MKKIITYVLSIFAFLFFCSSRVNALDYNGNLGYNYTSEYTVFYLLVDNENIKEIKVIIDEQEKNLQLEDGIYIGIVTDDLKGKEYYYKVCYLDNSCIDTIDPFSKNININGTRNVIMDQDSLSVEGWDSLKTNDVANLEKVIYAIEAEKFTQKIENNNVETNPDGNLGELYPDLEDEDTEPGIKIADSVLGKLIAHSKYQNTSIGYDYLSNLNFSYLEVGNLYDPNNYFSINQEYSSKENNSSAIIEYKSFLIRYKDINKNVILRTNFMTLSEGLKQSLLNLSPDFVNGNMINLNNEYMKKYLKDVYTYWVNEYKIDGFYIEDAYLYDIDYLNNLIQELKSINSKLLIYANNADVDYHISNSLQESLFGDLKNAQDTGVINGDYSEETFAKLINAMFSDYVNDFSKSQEAIKIINNFGSFEGLDIYSKLMLVSGLGVSNSIINYKFKLSLYTLFASAGIPRIISGNEFLNTNLVDSDSTVSKICRSIICYAIGNDKSINWEYLNLNSPSVNVIEAYRSRYTYQFPNYYSMGSSNNFSYNKDLTKEGILLLEFGYDARYAGDIQRSLLLINFSGEDKQIDSISDFDYSSVSPIFGKVSENDGKTSIMSYTFFTFTEVKQKKFSNFVYILIVIALFALIFGIRAILIKLLKDKKGIDYNEYAKEQKQISKYKRKNKIRDPSIFETYLLDDETLEAVKKRREEKRQEKMNKKQEKKNKQKENSNVEKSSNEENSIQENEDNKNNDSN